MKKKYQKAAAARIEIGTQGIIAASGEKSASYPGDTKKESTHNENWGSLWKN